MSSDYYKLPRLYLAGKISVGDSIALDKKQSHYLLNVMRKNEGDTVRIFNGIDGEFLTGIRKSGKNAILNVEERIKEQPDIKQHVHLIFAPVKKHRMDILIEKSVELGVTAFHPVVTDHSDVRKINNERLNAQIIEAAEQCERLDLPALHSLVSLEDKLKAWPDYITLNWCYERSEDPPQALFSDEKQGFLIGPVGGFSQREVEYLSAHPKVSPVSLGEQVLRVETAALVCLARVQCG